MRRGKRLYWLLENQFPHPQSSLLPIRVTEIGRKGHPLIGHALGSDWCYEIRRPQSCTKTPSPSIHALIRASQKSRVTGFQTLITSEPFELQVSNSGSRQIRTRRIRCHIAPPDDKTQIRGLSADIKSGKVKRKIKRSCYQTRYIYTLE